jgi:hypothetical protein
MFIIEWINKMTSYNEPPNYYVNNENEVVGSEELVVDTTITKKNDINYFCKSNEIEEEALCCFVLGYN